MRDLLGPKYEKLQVSCDYIILLLWGVKGFVLIATKFQLITIKSEAPGTVWQGTIYMYQ